MVVLGQKPIPLAVFAPQTQAEYDVHDTDIGGESHDSDVDARVGDVEQLLQGIRLAVQDINGRSDLLPGHQLKLLTKDTKCNIGYATKELFEIVQPNEQPCFMLIGADCDKVTQQIATVSKFWNLLTVSYGSTTPSLSNRLHYNYFFRTIPTDSLYYRAYLAILRQFNWTRVSILQEQYDQTVADRFRYTLTTNNIHVQDFVTFGKDADASFQQLKIYRYGLYGKNYAWLFTPHKYIIHKSEERTPHNCTDSQLSKAMEGVIVLEYHPVSPFDTLTITGTKVSQLSKRVLDVTKAENLQNRIPYGYDSIWAAALALNTTRQFYMKNNGEDILQTFNYNRQDIRRKLMEYMQTISFTGLSGPVGFTNDGDRKGLVMIGQMQNNKSVIVGYYNDMENQITTNGYTPFKWQGGKPPADKPAQITRKRMVGFNLYFGTCLAAGSAAGITLFFLLVNTIFQNHRYIRLTNPGINNVLLFGILISYATIPLLEINYFGDRSSNFLNMLCLLRYWVLLMGAIIPYSVMVAKMWRTYAVVTNIVRAGKDTYEVAMAIVMTVIIAIPAAILLLWNIVDPVHIQDRIGKIRDDDGNEILSHRLACSCQSYQYFLGSIYGYFTLLVLCGLYLAKETHQISSVILTDAKWISISAVNYALYVAAAPIGFFAGLNSPDVNFAILSLAIIYVSTSAVLIIFVPAMIAVCKYRSLTITEVAGFANSDRSEANKIISLGIENISLQQRLNAQDAEIDKLKTKILQTRKSRGEESKFYIPKKHYCKISSITLGGTQTSVINSYQNSQEGPSLSSSTVKEESSHQQSTDQPIAEAQTVLTANNDQNQEGESIEMKDLFSQPTQEVVAVIESNSFSRHSESNISFSEEVAPVILRVSDDEKEPSVPDRYSLLRNEDLLNKIIVIDSKDGNDDVQEETDEEAQMTTDNEQTTSHDGNFTDDDDCFDHIRSNNSEQVFDEEEQKVAVEDKKELSNTNPSDQQQLSDTTANNLQQSSEANPSDQEASSYTRSNDQQQPVNGRTRTLSYINEDGFITSDV
ncbi:uncharacterized protein TRIADDRAFT_51358 [Trichoplax adhaerens]|uniref:G-protein coupled receptors family 3 profile domain-containing protein n=1 Tax=Trichoplax adhaerens TaxID=10228 RepID=B3RIT4_TRIAD|nr:hypothetical protein TRIADDRAFT_51358 [Trichoplax adhaerens]EDV28445.1 hypothetical protein TRIADDRAFT_51358 [Trichoplax adhaerens]|eukprot:XP_002107647.1 hypothetical protein TRIADDRAFT_51358 [Trichoplax adhaerens]